MIKLVFHSHTIIAAIIIFVKGPNFRKFFPYSEKYFEKNVKIISIFCLIIFPSKISTVNTIDQSLNITYKCVHVCVCVWTFNSA